MKKFIVALFICCFSGSYACEKCTEDMLTYVEVMKYYKDHTENEYWKAYMDGTVNGLNISLKLYEINHKVKND